MILFLAQSVQVLAKVMQPVHLFALTAAVEAGTIQQNNAG
jgi:hypothetical protein